MERKKRCCGDPPPYHDQPQVAVKPSPPKWLPTHTGPRLPPHTGPRLPPHTRPRVPTQIGPCPRYYVSGAPRIDPAWRYPVPSAVRNRLPVFVRPPFDAETAHPIHPIHSAPPLHPPTQHRVPEEEEDPLPQPLEDVRPLHTTPTSVAPSEPSVLPHPPTRRPFIPTERDGEGPRKKVVRVCYRVAVPRGSAYPSHLRPRVIRVPSPTAASGEPLQLLPRKVVRVRVRYRVPRGTKSLSAAEAYHDGLLRPFRPRATTSHAVRANPTTTSSHPVRVTPTTTSSHASQRSPLYRVPELSYREHTPDATLDPLLGEERAAVLLPVYENVNPADPLPLGVENTGALSTYEEDWRPQPPLLPVSVGKGPEKPVIPSFSTISAIVNSIKSREGSSCERKCPADETSRSVDSMFSRAANSYESNWGLGNEFQAREEAPEEEAPVDSNDFLGDFRHIGPCTVQISPTRLVDLSDPAIDHRGPAILHQFLQQHEKRPTMGYIVKVLPTIEVRISGLKSREIHEQYRTAPPTDPGKVSCEACFKPNIPRGDLITHLRSDRHQLFANSFQPKLPHSPASPPPYSLIWCSLCDNYFMLTFRGCTINSHSDSPRHKKANHLLYFYLVMWKGCEQASSIISNRRTSDFLCNLSDLRNTRVKMLPPTKSKYIGSSEAMASYRRTYATLLEKGLV